MTILWNVLFFAAIGVPTSAVHGLVIGASAGMKTTTLESDRGLHICRLQSSRPPRKHHLSYGWLKPRHLDQACDSSSCASTFLFISAAGRTTDLNKLPFHWATEGFPPVIQSVDSYSTVAHLILQYFWQRVPRDVEVNQIRCIETCGLLLPYKVYRESVSTIMRISGNHHH